MHNLRQSFMLDPKVTFLNHGSFGAVPKPVFRAYQFWQRELERQPVEFLGRRFPILMQEARSCLAQYIHASPGDVVFTPNVTVSVNIASWSLELGEGDEVLTTDHEYGACERIWRFLSRERKFRVVQQPIPLPIRSEADFVDSLWRGVTGRTKVIFLSHITSPTAVIFPVKAVCERARREGLLTIVDGAHAPGQVPLDMGQIGADFYGGNLHKWLCAPKGAGFLYVKPEVQHLLKPFIISWGYESANPSSSKLVDYHEWTGTRDVSAFLSVPEAIKFQEEHHWESVRKDCHQLACDVQRKICRLTGLDPFYMDDRFFPQFVSVPLPDKINPTSLKEELYNQFLIEVPVLAWNGKNVIRVSVQGYNTSRDINVLVDALRSLMQSFS
jgi:isopenicillin-N epimerase